MSTGTGATERTSSSPATAAFIVADQAQIELSEANVTIAQANYLVSSSP